MIGGGLYLKPYKTFYPGVHLNYLYLHASDAYTANPHRKARNLSVHTQVGELNFLLHARKRTITYPGTGREFRGGIGLGFYTFTPRAMFENQWYNLAELHTEGQNFLSGKSPYKTYGISIPYYLGVAKPIGRYVSFGIEIQGRKLFTDYLDDVSTTYADNAEIAAQNGTVAASLADQNLSGNPRLQGSKRGNHLKNDHYFYVSLTFRKTLTSKFSRFGRSGGSPF